MPVKENGKDMEEDSFLPTADEHLKLKQAKKNGDKIGSSELDDTEVNYKEYRLCARLQIDHPFRRRFTHTLWLFWAFIGLGWCVGQMGPSFPDLRLIVQKDLETAAWLFTIFSIGYLVGSFSLGIVYDKLNKLMLISISVVVMSISTGVLPWCENFSLMMALRFIAGLGAGGLDTGANADLVSIWDEEGRPYMQALHFCFGFGGIISPLVLEPFLAEKSCVPVPQDNNATQPVLNVTTSSIFDNSTNQPDNTTTSATTCVDVYEETQIHTAYLISAVLILSGGIPFIYMYIKTACSRKERHMVAKKDNQERPDNLQPKLKILLCLLLCLLMFMYCAVEDTFSGFLATFCISHFKWAKGQASYATSTHWGAFSIGRFSGIFLVMRFKPMKLIGTYLICLIISFSVLIISSLLNIGFLFWIFIACAGFSMSVVFGSIFTWTEESIMKVSSMISSFFLISASLGLMVNPLFLGYLMEQYTPLWFVYLLFGESCICLALYLSIVFIVKSCVHSKPKTGLEMEIEVSPCEEMKPMAKTAGEN